MHHCFLCLDLTSINSNCVEDRNEPLWNINYDCAPEWMKNCFHQVNSRNLGIGRFR